MILSDGNEYEIGRIQAHSDLTAEQLVIPAAHSRRKSLPLTWQPIEPTPYLVALWKRWPGEATYSQLIVSKIGETKDKWGNRIDEEGSTDQADYVTIDIARVRALIRFQQPILKALLPGSMH